MGGRCREDSGLGTDHRISAEPTKLGSALDPLRTFVQAGKLSSLFLSWLWGLGPMNRFRRAFGRQDWVAVAIELIVVVLGILIALQVDQWAQRRQEHDLEKVYLLRLKQDLQIEHSRATKAEDWARDRLEAVAVLNRLSSDLPATEIDPAALLWAIETASWRTFPKGNAFVYNELQNSGNMRVIRSVALRRQLAEHYAELAIDAWVGEDRAAEEKFDQATAGLLNAEELMAFERVAGDRRQVTVEPGRAQAVAAGFLMRGDALAQLPSVAQHHLFNLRVIGDQKARIQRLIAEVDSELRQRH